MLYKRPTDLVLGKDVPVCCNIVLCDMLDEGAPIAMHVMYGSVWLLLQACKVNSVC